MSKDRGAIDQGQEPKNELDYPAVVHTYNLQNLEGRLLTIIESAFSDKTQREAVKSLARTQLWNWFNSRELPRIEKDNNGVYKPVDENSIVYNQ